MNIITRKTKLQDKNGNTFDGPDPNAILGGYIEVRCGNTGIGLVPNVDKLEDGRLKCDDMARVEAIFPCKDGMGDGLVRGRWIDPVHFELSRPAVDQPTGKPQKAICIYLRTQSPADRSKVYNSCPKDQTTVYRVGWKGNQLQFVNADDTANRPSDEQQEHARVSSLFDPDLETEAALFGVAWDDQASRETMVDRVVAASMKKKRENETAAAAAYGEEQKEASMVRTNQRKRNAPATAGAALDE